MLTQKCKNVISPVFFFKLEDETGFYAVYKLLPGLTSPFTTSFSYQVIALCS